MGARKGSGGLSVPPQSELQPCGGVAELPGGMASVVDIIYGVVIGLDSIRGLDDP